MTDVTPPVVDPGTGTKPWYEGAAPEFIGRLETRGLKDKSPLEVALHFEKAHGEAEKFIGAPANQLLRIPTDPKDEAAWKTYYEKIGVPADAKGYDLSSLKKADGSDLTEAEKAFYADTALKANLPKNSVGTVVSALLARDAAVAKEAADNAEAALALEQQALDKSWGANKAGNLLLAQQMAAKLGIGSDEINALEKVVGYSKVMNLMLTLATKTGEHTFVNPEVGTPGTGPLTREQALAEIADLKKDQEWTKSYMAGDVAKGRRWTYLHTVAHG